MPLFYKTIKRNTIDAKPECLKVPFDSKGVCCKHEACTQNLKSSGQTWRRQVLPIYA